MEIYARQLRVSRYFLFDPLDARFEGSALDAARRAYLPLAPLEGGDLPVHVLGLGLGVREGTYPGEGGRWLRWLGPDGPVIQTGEERAEAERARAEAERQRAEDLEARLAAYEARFGPLSG